MHRQGRRLLAQPLVVQVSAAPCMQRSLLHAALHYTCGSLAAAAAGMTAAAAAARALRLAAAHCQAPRFEAPRSPDQGASPSPAATAHFASCHVSIRGGLQSALGGLCRRLSQMSLRPANGPVKHGIEIQRRPHRAASVTRRRLVYGAKPHKRLRRGCHCRLKMWCWRWRLLRRCRRCRRRRRCIRRTTVIITIAVDAPTSAECTYSSLRRRLQHRRQHRRPICNDNRLRRRHGAIIVEHACARCCSRRGAQPSGSGLVHHSARASGDEHAAGLGL